MQRRSSKRRRQRARMALLAAAGALAALAAVVLLLRPFGQRDAGRQAFAPVESASAAPAPATESASPVQTAGTRAPSASPKARPSAEPTPAPQVYFRKTKWGMSRSEVLRSEKGVEYQDLDRFVYALDLSVSGMKATAFCFFDDDGRLFAANYAFTEPLSAGESIDDYSALLFAGSNRYGRPAAEERIWSDGAPGDSAGSGRDPAYDYGAAVSRGELVYRASWRTANTDIVLLLGAEDSEPSLELYYLDRTSSQRLNVPNLYRE